MHKSMNNNIIRDMELKNMKNAPFPVVALAICIITGLFGRGVHLLCISEQLLFNTVIKR